MVRDGHGTGLPSGLAPCGIAPWPDIQVAQKSLQGRDADLFREIFGRMLPMLDEPTRQPPP